MKDTPKIEISLSYRYPLALYTGFHQQILDIWDTLGEAKWPVLNLTKTQVDRYKEIVQSLTDYNRRTRASVTTLTMKDYEIERDNLISTIQFTITNRLKSTKPEIRAAAQALEIAFRPYKGMQSMADDAETAAIYGLLEDFRSDENAEHVTTLMLDATMEELQEANLAFDQAKSERHANAMAKSKEPSTLELRAELDELEDDMYALIYATALMHGEGRTTALQTIDKINTMVRRYKTSFKQSEGQKGPEVKPEEGEESGEGGFEPIPVPDDQKTE